MECGLPQKATLTMAPQLMISAPSEHKLTVADDHSPPPEESKTARVQRAQWLRAAILGANDGLLSTSTLMLGVSSAKEDQRSMLVSGLAGAVAGAFSMALGEFVSVSTQRDIEEEVNTNAISQTVKVNDPVEAPAPAPAPAPSPCRSPMMRAMAAAAEEEAVLPSPAKAAAASGVAFMVGSALPLLSSGFVSGYRARVLVLVAVTTVALAGFGAAGARLGGSRRVRFSAARVLAGGWLAMGITYFLLKPLDNDD